MRKTILFVTTCLSMSMATSKGAAPLDPANFETTVSFGLGVGFQNSIRTEPRLFLNVATTALDPRTHRPMRDPDWEVRILFSEYNPEPFFPFLYDHEENLVVAGAIAGAAIGGLTYLAAAKAPAIMTVLGMGAAGGIVGGLATLSIIELAKFAEKKYTDSEIKDPYIYFNYKMKNRDVDVAQTANFVEVHRQALRNDEGSIIRQPIGTDLRDNTKPAPLFSKILTASIPTIAELYGGLNRLMTRTINGVTQSLRFSGLGISNTEYIRNWNSYAILVGHRLFDIPFHESDNRILIHSINNRELLRDWESSERPNWDKVVAGILASYGRITAEDPQFRMNRPSLEAINKAFLAPKINISITYPEIHHWTKVTWKTYSNESEITKLLKDIPDDAVVAAPDRGAAAAVGGAAAAADPVIPAAVGDAGANPDAVIAVGGAAAVAGAGAI